MTSRFLNVYLLLAATVLATAAGGCGQEPEVQTLSGLAQGTTYHVSVWAPEGLDTGVLQRAIDAEFARLDKLLSNYRTDSAIEQFNGGDSTGPFQVGREIVHLVKQAQKVSEASHGCYDLTVKTLFHLWGFDGVTLTPPSKERLHEALGRTGFRHLGTPTEDTLSKAIPGLQVDLSSIAQGYSVDRIAALLERRGLRNYLVEIGGELQARGTKPGGAPWRVAVERPLPGKRSLQKILTIKRTAPLAIMTSGTYRHFFDRDGRRYSHVLDARIGRPIAHHTLSVTVLHGDPTLADAWSTALLCLGRQAGLEAADKAGIAALFIDEESGDLREFTTRAYAGLSDVEME